MFSSWFLGTVAWFAAAWPLQAEPNVEAEVAEAGRKFALLQADGDFHEAGKMISEYLVQRFSPATLQQTWASQSRNLGYFKDVASAKATVKGRQRYVDVECEWQRGRRSMQLNVDENNRITGILWMPLAGSQPEAYEPPPADAAAAKTVPIILGREPWTLAGTLTLPPAGSVRAAAVLIHDRGRVDRDATMGANKPFRDLALGLAGKGIAVLRYEKRTEQYADKLATVPTTTKDEVIDDGLQAVEALRARKEVAGVPIVLIGYGFGGTLTPQIAASAGNVAGIVLLGAVARSCEEVIADHIEYTGSFLPEEGREERLNPIREKANSLRVRTLPPTEHVMGAKASFWYDFADRDAEVAVKQAASFTGRILVIQGGRDYVAGAEDFRLWQAGLSKHPQATFQLFEDLNHAFAKGRGKSSALEFTVPKPLDERVINLIADWAARLGSAENRAAP